MEVFHQFEGLYRWGLDMIRLVQSADAPLLGWIALGFTALGEPLFYIAILPLVYWCIDARFGARLGLMVILSGALNQSIKDALAVPRPFVVDPSVGKIPETGFSTPSGHAQGSAGLWPVLAHRAGRGRLGSDAGSPEAAGGIPAGTSGSEGLGGRWRLPSWAAVVLALAMPFLIGMSRVYLGVHYPSDVLLGWILGGLFAAGFILFQGRLGQWVRRSMGQGPRKVAALALSVLVPLAMVALSPRDASLACALLGFALGNAALVIAGLELDAGTGSPGRKALRLLAGLGLLGAVYFGLRFLFPAEGQEGHEVFRLVRYGLVGLGASLGAPVLFKVLGLGVLRQRGD